MKILVLTDKMDIGGAETHIYTLICEIMKRGDSVTLISAGGAYADKLQNQGVRCIDAPLDKRSAHALNASLKIIKHELYKHDIVHAHTRFTAFLSKHARKDKKFPSIVTTAHLNFPLFPFGPLAYWGDMTLAVSDDIKDYLSINYRIPENKIHKTKNSIDTSLFFPSNIHEKIIVHTSRIDTGRSLTAFMLVSIAEKIAIEYPNFKILIVGSGNKYQKLTEVTENINKKIGFPTVILTGSRSNIFDIIKHGVLFVGVSRSALEGMAAGLPTIICGDEGYGGIVGENNFDELSKSNFCARGFQKPNPDILFNDIKYLIDNKNLANHLGAFLRSRIETDYAPSSMADDAYECYAKSKKPRVLLIGYFGYNNLGDEETLNSAIEALLFHDIKNISILSAKIFYKNKHKTQIKVYNRMSISKIAEAVNSSDIVILCGGNLLQNETSTRSLIYYSRIISYAKSRGRRIFMISSGFGKISGALGKHLLKKSIESCDFCGCRTRYDLKIASEYNSNAVIMPDLCFLLPSNSHTGKQNNFAWIVNKNSKIKIAEIRKIEKLRNLQPIIIMLSKSEDSYITELLKDENINFFTAHSFNKFTSLINNCAFTICERLHGAIFSILCHTPAYITDDSCKNNALLDEVNHRCKNTNPILLRYNISDIISKKEIGAQDSDFKYVIDDFKNDINYAFENLF